MKSCYEPIAVDLGDDGVPRALRWRRCSWRVLRVLDRWVLQSRWWAREERRDYLLVEAAPDGPSSPPPCAMEIYLHRQAGAWVLARVLG